MIEMVSHTRIFKSQIKMKREGHRTSFGTRTEFGSGGGNLINGEIVQKLYNIVAEFGFELVARPHHTIIETDRSFLQQSPLNGFDHLHLGILLSLERFSIIGGIEIRIDIFGILFENLGRWSQWHQWRWAVVWWGKSDCDMSAMSLILSPIIAAPVTKSLVSNWLF